MPLGVRAAFRRWAPIRSHCWSTTGPGTLPPSSWSGTAAARPSRKRRSRRRTTNRDRERGADHAHAALAARGL